MTERTDEENVSEEIKEADSQGGAAGADPEVDHAAPLGTAKVDSDDFDDGAAEI